MNKKVKGLTREFVVASAVTAMGTGITAAGIGTAVFSGTPGSWFLFVPAAVLAYVTVGMGQIAANAWRGKLDREPEHTPNGP